MSEVDSWPAEADSETRLRAKQAMKIFNWLLGLAMIVVFSTTVAYAQDIDNEQLSIKQVVSKVKKGVIRVMGIDVESPIAAGVAGGGSGFVFEVDYDTGIGYAITNHHVSGSASLSAVMFWDDAQYRAEMIATEPGIDVSLLKIYGLPDERNLPEAERTIVPVALGDSDRVQIGEWAIAIGNPGSGLGLNTERDDSFDDFLLQQTVTKNVVTGRDTPLEFMVGIWRQNRSSLGYQYGTNFDYAFRISVPINGGNSGGPLFNGRGEVIGINFYGGGWAMAQNHNWAVPINLAKDFVFSVIDTGKFERPWLGMDIIMPSYITGPEQYIEFTEKWRGDEIKVFGVRADSPAQRAGLQVDDVIVESDGRVFATPEDLRLYIMDLDIGAMVEFTVIRKRHEMTVWAEVGPKRKYNSEFSV